MLLSLALSALQFVIITLFILCYNATMTTPWNKIKAEYLQGVAPKELAAKYNINASAIHTKFNKDGTSRKLRELTSNLSEEIRDKIDKATTIAIRRLTEMLESAETKDADLVAATRAILDVSGLKSQKLETTITELPVIKDDI